MSDPDRLRGNPALRTLLASADDDGPSALQLEALRARVRLEVRAERARRVTPIALGAVVAAAAVFVAIVLTRPGDEAPRREPSERPVAVVIPLDAAPALSPVDAQEVPGSRGSGSGSGSVPPTLPAITIESDPKNDIYIDMAFKGRGSVVVRGRAGQELVAGCERFDRRTYQHYKPGFLHMKFTDADQTATCRTTPPPRKGYTWDNQRGWVPVTGLGP